MTYYQTHLFTATRLTFTFASSVYRLLDKLDIALRREVFQIGDFEKRAAVAKTRNEFEAVVASKLGSWGFMLFGVRPYEGFMGYYPPFNTTAATTLPVMRVYIIGNPLIAATMIPHDLTAGLHVPLSLIVVGDEKEAYICYDLPSSVIDVEGTCPKLQEAVEKLDKKVEALVRFVTDKGGLDEASSVTQR